MGGRSISIRGARRTTADHSSDQIQSRFHVESQRPESTVLLSKDERLDRNYQRLVHSIQQTYLNPSGSTDHEVATEALKLLRQLQASTTAVFPDLRREGLGDPTSQGTFLFSKRNGTKWRYVNLSSREKSAFDLLVDLVLTAARVSETIYCIDEPELHMHSELQCRLMQEVNRIAPHGWQIWLATHSIGMVRWATQSLEAEPETVAFLDFHNRDFDHPVEIIPSIPNRSFWQSQFRVAIGELADLIVPRELFVCEGDNEEGFDANVLQAIFGNTHPDSAFQSVGSCRDVEKSGALLTSQLQRLTPGCKVRRLFDRDDRTEAEISECRAKGDRVLSVREIENYLFDFHVLEALVIQKGDLEQWEAVKREIEAEIASLTTPARNKQSDDIKSAAPRIHQIMRSKLRLEQAGSKYTHFALEFLVPLIVPGTKIYAALETLAITGNYVAKLSIGCRI